MNTDLILIENFINNHPESAARILEDLPVKEIVAFIGEIKLDLAVQVFSNLEQYTATRCLEMLDEERSAKIIEGLPLENSAVLLRQINAERREPLLMLVSKELAIPLRRMLQYPEDTAGSLIDPIVLTLPEDITVGEGSKRLQENTEKAMYYLYVLRRDDTLAGVISMRELMLAQPKDQLKAVMQGNVERLSAEANIQTIIDHPGWLSYHTLPVVDPAGIFLGIIGSSKLRQIETRSQRRRLSRQAISAGNALAELYRIGMSGLIRSAAEGYQHQKEK